MSTTVCLRYSSISAVVVSLLLIMACGGNQQDIQAKSGAKQFNASPTTVTVNCGAFCTPPSLTYTLPSGPCNNNQTGNNCFAWSNFIALNWLASGPVSGHPDSSATAADFGEPGDFRPVVWESFMSIDEVFGTEPMALAARGTNTKAMTHIKQVHKLSKIENSFASIDRKMLRAKASLDDKMNEIFQAQGTWLTDQKGNVVWYEVRLNPTESDFIRKNRLYNYDSLQAYAAAQKGVWLPNESIEVKAAWKLIDSSDLETAKPYYKISQAMVPTLIGFDANKQPVLGDYQVQYLGLVGFHIIRKTPNTPQFTWMTFEHIHNAPTEGAVDSTIAYNFYNKASTATPNQSPVPGKDDVHTPVQVVRIAANAISSDIKTLNDQIHAMIHQSNPNSVWQYYQLINVQWTQSPVSDATNNKTVPLQMGGINPSNIANATLETYAQTTQCMSCHQYGGISGSNLPTDYSFVFLKAKPVKLNSKKGKF